MQDNEQWLSIIEYSICTKKSISTIRRYIKANRLKFKEVDGKYLIFTNKVNKKIIETDELEIKIKKLEQENLELKMLVDLYEQKFH